MMNETIRELLLQAREETREGNWKPPTAVWTERFAELIVKECIKVTLNHSKRDDDMGAIITNNIKEHFGVCDE